MTPTDQTSTLELIRGGVEPTTKVSGGRYQYVPAPCAHEHVHKSDFRAVRG